MDGDEELNEKDSRTPRAPFVGVALTMGCAFTVFLGVLAGRVGKGRAASSEGQDMRFVSRLLEAGFDTSLQSPSAEVGLIESRFLFPPVLIDSMSVSTTCCTSTALHFPPLLCRSRGLETLLKAWIPHCWATPTGFETAVVLLFLLGGGIAIASVVKISWIKQLEGALAGYMFENALRSKEVACRYASFASASLPD